MGSKLPGAGKFFLALLIFAVVYFMAPDGARPWLALVIVLGAILVASGPVRPGAPDGPLTGPLAKFADWYHGG